MLQVSTVSIIWWFESFSKMQSARLRAISLLGIIAAAKEALATLLNHVTFGCLGR